MPTLTKMDLVDAIVADVGIMKKQAVAAVETLLSHTASTLANGGEVSLTGVGKLKAYQRAAKVGRNPNTGEQISIAPRLAIRFRPSQTLVERLAAEQ